MKDIKCLIHGNTKSQVYAVVIVRELALTHAIFFCFFVFLVLIMMSVLV